LELGTTEDVEVEEVDAEDEAENEAEVEEREALLDQEEARAVGQAKAVGEAVTGGSSSSSSSSSRKPAPMRHFSPQFQDARLGEAEMTDSGWSMQAFEEDKDTSADAMREGHASHSRSKPMRSLLQSHKHHSRSQEAATAVELSEEDLAEDAGETVQGPLPPLPPAEDGYREETQAVRASLGLVFQLQPHACAAGCQQPRSAPRRGEVSGGPPTTRASPEMARTGPSVPSHAHPRGSTDGGRFPSSLLGFGQIA
jgi:hypothetical protein